MSTQLIFISAGHYYKVQLDIYVLKLHCVAFPSSTLKLQVWESNLWAASCLGPAPLLILLFLFQLLTVSASRIFTIKQQYAPSLLFCCLFFPYCIFKTGKSNQRWKQSEACTRPASKSAVLCQWHGCHSACYKSMNCKNDFETSSIIFEVDKQQCRFKHDIWGWGKKEKTTKEKKKVEVTYYSSAGEFCLWRKG